MLPIHHLDTPIGPLTVHWDEEGLVDAIDLPGAASEGVHVPLASMPAPARQVVEELREYFAGTRREFSVKLLAFPGTTPFRRAVYEYVFGIPAGETRSYGEVARAVGHPGAARAVGAAMATNPLPLVVPCHRVVAVDGMGGYGGGLCCKRALLQFEATQATT